MKKIKISKVIVDKNLCIGCGNCVGIAPNVFELNKEGKSIVKNKKGADDETIFLAAQSCPVGAIIVYNEKGKKIWPPV